MLKEAIEKILDIATPTILDREDGTFAVSADKVTQIRPELDVPATIKLTSLDALIKLVRTEASKKESPLYITIPSHLCVTCFGQPNKAVREYRQVYYNVEATDVPGWDAQQKLPFEQAAVALQTRFQEGGDREYTLRLLSQITTGAKVTYNDIGVATTVVTSKGVSLQENSQIRPLVRLRPYRTFQEIEQPEGLFLIRIDERGISFTEADGGMWKLEARKTVEKYLEDGLADLVDSGDVVIAL